MQTAFSLLLAALLHEGGHYAAWLFWGGKKKNGGASFRFGYAGAELRVPPSGSYSAALAVQLAGPAANLLTALVTLFFPGDFPRLLREQSLLLGGLQMLPIRGLDGGGALEATAALLWGERAAYRLPAVTSWLCLTALWLLSCCLLLLGSGNLSFFVLSFWLLCRQVRR